MQQFADGIVEFINSRLGPVASFLEGYVWSWPPDAPLLAIVLLGTGFFVTVRLALIQVRGFRHAIDIARGRYDDPKDAGDLKHFQALTTALSATVGIGNIAGVALAIRWGGPGALFWMWVTAFFGMALKYAECTLALRYRKVHEDGSVSGGPMYYIEQGLGASWKWMALTFAGLAAICSFGSGNMNQANTMADSLESQFGIAPLWTGLVFATLIAMVIIGGIKRIGRVTSILAPTMAVIYVGGALMILVLHIGDVLPAFATIFREAFSPTSLTGGAAGSFLLTLMWGVRRGLFSNEAGQGSAPIAHATAKTDEPVREGLVASLGPFIDTLVICSMTGLVIVVTGAWKEKVEQTYDLATVEVVAAAPVSDDDVAARLLEQNASTASSRLEVSGGEIRGATFVSLDATLLGVKLEDASGEPWTGTLELAAGSAVPAVVGGGEPPTVRGRGLLIGAPLTARGFALGLPGEQGNLIVTLSVILFAVSTAISWSYYGDRATEYLFGRRGPQAIRVYRWIYVGFFFLGCLLPLQTVWVFGDVALGLMSFPNLIALVLLTGPVVAMTREYYSREHKPFR